jgi:uncharacterized protein (TIGR02284 family)
MRTILLATAAMISISACAQMKTSSEPTSAAASRLAASETVSDEADNLNHLAKIAIDAKTLYGEAAAEADDAQLAAELKTLASERAAFAGKLQQRVASLGGEPAESGQAVGTVHRSFTAVRGLVQNDSVAAAAEVYRGESYMIDELGKALDTSLSPISREIVDAELASVKESRNRIERLQAGIETRLKTEDDREDAAEKASDAG